MIPLLNKEMIKAITQNVTPEQAEYVAGINTLLQDVNANCPEIAEKDQCDDVIFVAKIMAFADKFKALHWAAASNSYHEKLDDFHSELEGYKDAIAENIQSIIGQFVGDEFTKLELPLGNDPLVIINELKQCVENWFVLHEDDMNYEGCRNQTSGFIETIHKYVYLFRLCKNGCID